MTQQTCSTCRHWRGFTNSQYGECGNIGAWNPRDKDFAFIELDASDDDGLYAQLNTRKDFGCNEHKEL